MPARSQTFELGRSEPLALHYLEWGTPGPRTLVLLHGGGANAYWWNHLGPQLAANAHVVALDFRGHGDSVHPAELAENGFLEDLGALLAHLRCARPLLIGHSMGGRVALAHAARHTEVAGLVLVDVPVRSFEQAQGRREGDRLRRVARLALRRRQSYPSRSIAIERFRFLPPLHGAAPSLRDDIASHSVVRQRDGRFSYNFDPRWFDLPTTPGRASPTPNCQTLVIRGTESELLSHSAARAFTDSIPRGQLVEIEAAGHHLHIDRPEAFLAAVCVFQSKLDWQTNGPEGT